MKRALASLAFVLLAAVAARGAEKTLFEEKFDGKLAEGWSWLRENPKAWRVQDGALEIRVEPGTAGDVKNALVRKLPAHSGKIAVEVTVTFTSPPTKQFEQAGITWYRDGRPAFKLVHELIDGAVFVVPGKKPAPEKTVQLRLVLDGANYVALFRPDGKGEFVEASRGPLAIGPDDQVSLQCYQGPADQEHWMRFDDFRIVELGE